MDPHSDELDGYLFRLWCRAASYPEGRPSVLMRCMSENTPKTGNVEPHHYRAALMSYAKETGANLPE